MKSILTVLLLVTVFHSYGQDAQLALSDYGDSPIVDSEVTRYWKSKYTTTSDTLRFTYVYSINDSEVDPPIIEEIFVSSNDNISEDSLKELDAWLKKNKDVTAAFSERRTMFLNAYMDNRSGPGYKFRIVVII